MLAPVSTDDNFSRELLNGRLSKREALAARLVLEKKVPSLELSCVRYVRHTQVKLAGSTAKQPSMKH